MTRLSAWGLLLLLLVCGGMVPAAAQTPRPPAVGDPPVAAQITVTAPDAAGFVNVTGASGAVWPSAFVGVRNLYTYETVYVQAGAVGAFGARLRATANAPLAVVPTQAIPPPEGRFYPGSLPGGPGTIVTVPADPAPIPPEAVPIALDGDSSEWANVPLSQLHTGDGLTIRAVRGSQSIYLAVVLTDPARISPAAAAAVGAVTVTLRGDGGAFTFRFTRQDDQFAPAASLTSTFNRTPRPLIAPAAWQTDADGGFTIEARIPTFTDTFRPLLSPLTLEAIAVYSADDALLTEQAIGTLIPTRPERDGLYRANRAETADWTPFTLGGVLSRGESYWTAAGRINTLTTEADAPLTIELDVTLRGELDPALGLAARLIVTPIAQPDAGGTLAAVPDAYTNNGWSNAVLPGGLAIDNLIAERLLAEVRAPRAQIWRGTNEQGESILRFPLTFSAPWPPDLPPGLYGFRLEPGIVRDDGRGTAFTRWEAWPSFTVVGGWTTFGFPADPIVRLPVIVRAGMGDDPARLPFALFMDDAAEGSRGVLPAEDAERFALSTRTRFTAPIPALPRTLPNGERRPYALEPYLPNLFPNLYDTLTAPLIPFDFSTGTWTVTVTRPDRGVDELGTFPLTQLAFSTPIRDERTAFGAASPLDTARLSAVTAAISAYEFAQYGDYTITATGTLQDVWGNTYTGGGTYTITAAEPIALLPAAPSGVPLTVGDRVPIAARVLPGVPAGVSADFTIYPLTASGFGEPRTRTISGRANDRGLFIPTSDAAFVTADQPGLYTLTYTARWRDPADSRIYAAAVHSAGVIETPASPAAASGEQPARIVAHGRRGAVEADAADPRPAWYDLSRYADVIGQITIPGTTPIPITPYTPYHSGDVVWIGAAALDALQPALTVHAPAERYPAPPSDAITPPLATAQGESPLRYGSTNPASGLALHSWTRPGVTVRQFVSGGDDVRLPTEAAADDPLAGQIGAGLNGARPGDYVFLYGGAVLLPTADQPGHVSGYGALAVHQSPQSPRGGRVYPPGRARDGGADGGPLFTFAGQEHELFFWPTATRPGDVLTIGDPLVVAGQVAPLLPASVTLTITAPDGTTQTIAGTANRFGWFVPPDAPPIVDQVGAWQIAVDLAYQGRTSAGLLEQPLTGGVLGGFNAADAGATERDRRSFVVFVADTTPDLLPWPTPQADAPIPPLLAYNFNFTVPADWTNVRAYRVLTIPGFMLEQGTIRLNGRSFTYQYAPSILNDRFPMLEDEQTGRGAAASDVRSLTLAVTGTDATGQPRLLFRTFTILYDRLVSREAAE